MRVSTRTRYGTRLMFQLALDYGKGFSLLNDIAKRENLSGKYLSLIVIPLKAQGLIVSARGAKGGYILSRHPSQISMREIVEALDGEIAASECLRDSKSCNRFSSCVTREVWKLLDDKIAETLASVKLQDLIEIHNKRKNPANNYEI